MKSEGLGAAGDRHISYLPLAHIYERVTCYGLTHAGIALGFYRSASPALLLSQIHACLAQMLRPSCPNGRECLPCLAAQSLLHSDFVVQQVSLSWTPVLVACHLLAARNHARPFDSVGTILKSSLTCMFPSAFEDLLLLLQLYFGCEEGGMRLGGGGHCSGNVLDLLEDVQELKPTIFCSVPRLWNRIYDKVIVSSPQFFSSFMPCPPLVTAPHLITGGGEGRLLMPSCRPSSPSQCLCE